MKISNETKVSLTFNEGGEHLVRPEITKMIINSKGEISYPIIKAEEFNDTSKTLNLDEKFILPAINERPKRQNHKVWRNSPEGKLFGMWNTISNERRLELACRHLVEALTGINYRDAEMKMEIL